MRRALTAIGLCSALAGLTALPSTALASETRDGAAASRMPEGRVTLAPFAFSRFCVRSPGDCAAGEEGELAWSTEARALVARVNRDVNRAIVARSDRRDDWRADVARGDCEDYALTKRRHLIERGLPSSALRIAVARTRDGEGHAVLVVRTDDGDFVLDNRFDRIDRWQHADLTWLKMTSGDNPRVWLTVDRPSASLSGRGGAVRPAG